MARGKGVRLLAGTPSAREAPGRRGTRLNGIMRCGAPGGAAWLARSTSRQRPSVMSDELMATLSLGQQAGWASGGGAAALQMNSDREWSACGSETVGELLCCKCDL